MSVQTVLGVIKPKDLGQTLTHEHFSLQYPYGSYYNLNFCDIDSHTAVKKDVHLFKELGGGSIVENTTHGLKRNLNLLYEISKETNVHVIAGTGYYVAGVQDSKMLSTTIEEMTKCISSEILTGCNILSTDDKEIINVKCGFIGEVGSGWPIEDFEKKAIQATAEIQNTIGCGVSFHPGRHPDAPFEIIRIYQEAGGNVNKCVMSHLDRTLLDTEKLLEFASLGTYCQFDLFGTECSYYQLNPSTNMPSDGQRIEKIVQLKNDKYLERILLSHDIHTKHRLTSFGGHGYSHILINVLPRLRDRGFTENEIKTITVDNPANWLQFNI